MTKRINKIKDTYFESVIQHIKKQYDISNIDDINSIWTTILDNDSSPNKKNIRWIVETLLNDGFLWEDMLPGKDSKVYETITLFDKHKSKLSIENRSLMAYKTLGNLWNSVKQYQGELSGKELKREEQEKIYRETEFIYKDEETGFQIVSPLTEESAKWWGKGTRWCTSADNDNMFDYYVKDAPLLIFVLPNGSKYQFWSFNKKIQFMDETDSNVSIFTVHKNYQYFQNLIETFYLYEYIREEDLSLDFIKNTLETTEINYKTTNGKKFFKKALNSGFDDVYNVLAKNNINVIEFFPHDKITEKMIIDYFVENFMYFESYKKTKFNPRLNFTEDMCIEILKQDTNLFNYLPHKFPKMIDYMIENDASKLLSYIKNLNEKQKADINYECLLEKIIEKDCYRIDDDDFKYLNVRQKYIQKNPMMLQYIPKQYIDEDLILYLLNNVQNLSPFALDKNKIWTQKIFEKYIEVTKDYSNCFIFKNKYFQKILSHDNLLLLVRTNRFSLLNINKNLITEDILIEHLKFFPENLFQVKHKKLSDYFYIQCLKNNFKLLELIPMNIKKQFSYDFYLENIKNNPDLLYYIPTEYKTIDLIKTAVSHGGSLLYVPHDFIRKPSFFNKLLHKKTMLTEQEINQGLKNDPSAISLISKDKLTKENYSCAFKRDPFSTYYHLPRQYQNDNFLKENFNVDFDWDYMTLYIKLIKQIIRYDPPENIKNFLIEHSQTYRNLKQQEIEEKILNGNNSVEIIDNIPNETIKKPHTNKQYEIFKNIYQKTSLTKGM